MTPQTLAQKLIARAAGLPAVAVGDVVTCSVDLAMFHDSSGPRRLAPMLRELNAPLWDKHRVVLVIDHHVPEHDDASRRIVRIARDWARDEALPHVYDSIGISHVVLPQHGHLKPGMLCVGGDSHSTTGGAFGAWMFGVSCTEMLGVLVDGTVWLKVPPTIFMRWIGRLTDGVGAKDMMLATIGRFGGHGGLGPGSQAVEYTGEAVAALDMAERMTLANMSAEIGAQVGLVAPDATTRAWLEGVGVDVEELGLARWHSDEGAPGVRHTFDASGLAPQVSLPQPDAERGAALQVRPVGDVEGTPVGVAYIGACTGAKLEDMRAAARVLAGYRVAPGVRLLVAPASVHDRDRAEREGVLHLLTEAGATLLPTACGACAGHGELTFHPGTAVISTTARPFRSGAAAPDTWLASPYTVAASALRGCISDPRAALA